MHFDVDDPGIKPFRILDHQLTAALYNKIKLGLIRIQSPLIITPKKLRNVKCYLYNDKWICVDLITNEFPLVVWRDFKVSQRGIHEPVSCKVHIYHIMAGRVMGTALYEIEDYINEVVYKDLDKIED